MCHREPPAIEIVQDRLIYKNQYGSLYDDNVRFMPSGARGTYVRWNWSASYSVAVLAMPTPDTALLVRSFRHAARREVLEAVKGFGHDSIDPADAARRELSEELGFMADDFEFLGIALTDPAFAYHPMHCFLASGRLIEAPAPELSEAISGPEYFRLRDLPSALATGNLQDAVTLMLLWQAFFRTAGERV